MSPFSRRVLSSVYYVKPLPAIGWPDATNTGYTRAPDFPGSLTPLSGPFTTSNITYSFRDIGQTTIGLDGGATPTNVTFHGCRFQVTAPGEALLRLYGSNITFEYCTFMPLAVAAPPVSYAQSYQYALIADGGYNTFVGALTVDHCELWGFHDAITLAGRAGSPLRIIKNSWFHDSADTGGTAHVDFIGHLTDNGNLSNITIDHNRMVGAANSSILGFQYGQYSNFSITNNLIGGGGYAVEVAALHGSPTNITFTDNTFTTEIFPNFGPLYPSTFWTGGGNLWRRNKWKVPNGAPWGNPAHDGWYWMPVGNDLSGMAWNDASVVSLTDYTG